MAPRRLALFPLWLAIGVGLCVFFLYACLMPHPPTEPGIPYFDKIEHAGAFVVMGAWFAALFPLRPGRVVLGLAAFALATEVLQAATGYRDGDVWDWCADVTGLCLGVAAARYGLMRWFYRLDDLAAANRN